MVQTIELIVAKVGAKEFRLFFYPSFTFCVPKSHKHPGVGGFTDLEKLSQKNFLFGGDLPLDPNADTKMIMGKKGGYSQNNEASQS